eukprot:scaffold45304_cov68-Phaeocystis_antarctica.AAC.1
MACIHILTRAEPATEELVTQYEYGCSVPSVYINFKRKNKKQQHQQLAKGGTRRSWSCHACATARPVPNARVAVQRSAPVLHHPTLPSLPSRHAGRRTARPPARRPGLARRSQPRPDRALQGQCPAAARYRTVRHTQASLCDRPCVQGEYICCKSLLNAFERLVFPTA